MNSSTSASRVMHPGALDESAIIVGARLLLHYCSSKPLPVLVISIPLPAQYGQAFRAVVNPDKYSDEQLAASMAGDTHASQEYTLADLGLTPYMNGEKVGGWNSTNYITRM